MRMGMRRFTPLTNGFSMQVENHTATIALHFVDMNFARPQKGLSNPYPRTPAMAVGLADFGPHLDVRRNRRVARLVAIFAEKPLQ